MSIIMRGLGPRLVFFAVVFNWYPPKVQGHELDCQLHNEVQTNGSNTLSFVHKSADRLFATYGHFRELHCESYNFCSIRWYFNGLPYESWKFGNGSRTHYFLEDRNQTLKFRSVDCDAKGFYTCEVSNGVETIHRRVELSITDPVWNEKPIQLQSSTASCQDQTTVLGGNASFFCQFNFKNPGPFFQHNWRKYNETSQKFILVDYYPVENTEFTQHSYIHSKTFQDVCSKKQTFANFSTWINITNVTEEALGEYQVVCRIAQNIMRVNLSLALQTPDPVIRVEDTTAIVITAMTLVTLFILSLLSWKRYGTDIKLLYHNHRGKKEIEDGKVYDAYIISSLAGRDRSFVYDILLPTLRGQYRLFLSEIDLLPGSVTSEEIVKAMNQSRRCIIVLSTDFYQPSSSSSYATTSSLPSSTSSPTTALSSEPTEDWHLFELQHALDVMRTHRHHIIPLIYRDFDPSGFESSDTITKIIAYIGKHLKCLKWTQQSTTGIDAWALKRLRLRLPPRQHGHGPSTSITAASSIAISHRRQHSALPLTSLPSVSTSTPSSSSSSGVVTAGMAISTMSPMPLNVPPMSSQPTPSMSMSTSSSPIEVSQIPAVPIFRSSSVDSTAMSTTSSTPEHRHASSSSSSSSIMGQPPTNPRRSLSPSDVVTPQGPKVFDFPDTQEYDLNSNNAFPLLNVGRILTKLSPTRRIKEPYLIDNETVPDGFDNSIPIP